MFILYLRSASLSHQLLQLDKFWLKELSLLFSCKLFNNYYDALLPIKKKTDLYAFLTALFLYTNFAKKYFL
jgi:hypothetical protein